ncbi:divergent polysaccharide deacetylase family protein [uncultured Sulfitobacter sp.]|uniref:divergent polysaccharide deacetylase family protein n=1 Tax=uncultured Sulfitobacter sp. TaxID=191468 RepID=UPI00262C23A3|nr:divergent polysaccharide deacetylase family protein [uncultured Sulfitobacter sp.]
MGTGVKEPEQAVGRTTNEGAAGMARGILSGIGLGAAFSVGVAGVVSILVPIEPQRAPETGQVAGALAPSVAPAQPSAPAASATLTNPQGSVVAQPQVTLRAPAGEELPKEPAAAARAPQVGTDVGNTDAAPAVTSTPVTSPPVETAALAPRPSPLAPVAQGEAVPQVPRPLPQPQTGTAGDLTTPRPLPEGVAVRVEDDAPVLPNPQALAPMIPDDSLDGAVAEQSALPPPPPAEGEEIFVVVPSAPETEQAPQQAQAPEQQADAQTPIQTEPQPDAQTQAQAETQSSAEPDSSVQTAPVVTAPAPRPRVLPAPNAQSTTIATIGTSSRPRIGTPANTLVSSTPAAGQESAEAPVQLRVDVDDASPLVRYGQPFENPEDKPLMSIVLMDTGVDLDAAAIGLPALTSFPYPVSFAVDVRLLDAAERMERYRAEGFDVLAMVDLPSGARPSDAEVSLSVALNGLPEVVGILEGTGEGLQGSREVADQVTGILKASGHGLVTQSKGLNSMPKLAVKEGVPAAPVFRDFDSQGQQARVIRRFLDQAAFKAGQEGGVIMLGRLRPETIEALLVWGLADRAGSVALAPVSAVLLDQR